MAHWKIGEENLCVDPLVVVESGSASSHQIYTRGNIGLLDVPCMDTKRDTGGGSNNML